MGIGRVCLVLLILASALQAEDDAGARARSILDSGGYQTELPFLDGQRPEARDEDARDRRLGGPALPVADLALWAAFVGGVVLLVIALRGKFAAPGDVRVAHVDETEAPAPTAARVVAMPSQELADAGDWTAAAHALLLETLTTLARETRTDWPQALTVREFIRRLRLDRAARSPLEHLLDAVERALYRGDLVDASLWPSLADAARRCLAERRR